MILFSKRALLVIMVSGLVIALLFWYIMSLPARDAVPAYVELSGERFTVEGAVTQWQQRKGLGDRESLCQTCAMLFLFEKSGRYPFWMKDMRFSLDIIWLLGDKVVFVAREVEPSFPGIIDPLVSADRVIEVNSGKTRGIEIGEQIRFSY